jgi:prepilin-type N-terminal cleavage/methylation domain-containing protein
MKQALRGKTQAGFTLIEMLIVITIVGILAAVAVTSYGTARKQAQLDFAADSLITAFKEQLAKAKSGQGLKSSTIQQQLTELQFACFGLRFQKNAPILQYFETAYHSVDDQGNADVCDSEGQLSPFSVEDIQLYELVLDDLPAESAEVLFKPPFAKLVARTIQSNFSNFKKMRITLGFKNSDQRRVVELDSSSGIAQRVQP